VIDGAIAEADAAMQKADSLLGAAQHVSPLEIIFPDASARAAAAPAAKDEGSFIIDGAEEAEPSPRLPENPLDVPLSPTRCKLYPVPRAKKEGRAGRASQARALPGRPDRLSTRISAVVSQLFGQPLDVLFSRYKAVAVDAK